MPKQENFPKELKEDIDLKEVAGSASRFLKDKLEYEKQATESEAHRNAAEMQAVKFETAILKLSRRTGGNTEIINAINKFVDSLTHQVEFGKDDEPLSKASEKDLTEYFEEKAEELRWDIGGRNRPADRKPTWTRKREKE